MKRTSTCYQQPEDDHKIPGSVCALTRNNPADNPSVKPQIVMFYNDYTNKIECVNEPILVPLDTAGLAVSSISSLTAKISSPAAGCSFIFTVQS